MRKHKILALILSLVAVAALSIVFTTKVEASQYNNGAGMVAIQLASDPNGTFYVSDPTGGYISYGGSSMTAPMGTGNTYAYFPGTYTSTPVTSGFTSFGGNNYTTTSQPGYSYTGAHYPNMTGTTPQYSGLVYAPNYSNASGNYTNNYVTTSPFARPQPTGSTMTMNPIMTNVPTQPQSVYYWGASLGRTNTKFSTCPDGTCGFGGLTLGNTGTGITFPSTTTVTQPQSVYYWGAALGRTNTKFSTCPDGTCGFGKIGSP